MLEASCYSLFFCDRPNKGRIALNFIYWLCVMLYGVEKTRLIFQMTWPMKLQWGYFYRPLYIYLCHLKGCKVSTVKVENVIGVFFVVSFYSWFYYCTNVCIRTQIRCCRSNTCTRSMQAVDLLTFVLLWSRNEVFITIAQLSSSYELMSLKWN